MIAMGITRRSLLGMAAIAFAGMSPAFAAGGAESYVTSLGNSVLAAARSGSVASFRQLLKANADIPAIALFSLGTYRKSLTGGLQAEYFALVERYISTIFAQNASR